jgi:flagellar basal body-associated protein FliL
MTLLDAPTYDPAKARARKNILIASLITVLVLAGFVWYFWNWPQEHRVNQFFAAIEAKDMPKAFAIWNHDGSSTRNNMRHTPMAVSKWIGATPATGATSRRTRL